MTFIPISQPLIGEDELRNVLEAVKSGWISSKGRFIEEFERQFAKYCGVRYGVATMNGTAALHLALEAIGVKEGDEVIVPTLTFIATANAVTYTGAKPVFVDSHPDYWCINPKKIEEKVTSKTKAIIGVHLYGHPCDMDPISEVAESYDLSVIEDAAEAHGAEYRSKKVGSLSDIGCFSFYGNKIMTTGEGGMCLTSNFEFAERMRSLRDHGMDQSKKYWHNVIGFNYRMTNLQAAIGLAQLAKLDQFIETKRYIYKLYNTLLEDFDESQLIFPREESWARSVFWMYSVLIEDCFSINRDELITKLYGNGIEARPFFYPIHTMPPYETNENHPIAQRLSAKGLNLPSGLNLTDDEIQHVVSCIRKAARKD